MKRKMQNPWLQIQAEDYEGHMSTPNVAQLQMLNKIFADVLEEFNPKSIAILGCTTGNGFEHLTDKNIERIVGVDINPKYISICKKRFGKNLSQLKLVCADLNEINFPDSSFDLIHAALVFEYVEVEPLLSKISHWIKRDGILSVVLQLPGKAASPVSETPYQSMKLLNPYMKLVKLKEFRDNAQKYGLEEIKNFKVEMNSGKSFSEIIFKQNKVGAQPACGRQVY